MRQKTGSITSPLFASAFRLIRASPRTLELRGATLLRLQNDLDHEMSLDECQQLATYWQQIVMLPELRTLQEFTSITRRFSDAREANRGRSGTAS